MKLLTLDMGADIPNTRLEDRLDALGTIIKEKRPEFFALQNVNNETIKKVCGSTWGTRYKVVHPQYKFETRKQPTVALFSTYPPEDSATVAFHENATHKVVEKGYYVMYDKQKQAHVINISTTLLEQPLKDSEMRERQLNEAFLSLLDDEDAFIIGNFCLDGDIDGDLTLRGGWKDAWLCIPGNTSENGNTYDPEKNLLVKEDPFGAGRPDRIFFKTRRYKLDSVEVVGTSSFQPKTGSAIHASKHFGLLAQFSPLDTLLPSTKPEMVACSFNRPQLSVDFASSK